MSGMSVVGTADGGVRWERSNRGERSAARTGNKDLYVCDRCVYTYTEDASV